MPQARLVLLDDGMVGFVDRSAEAMFVAVLLNLPDFSDEIAADAKAALRRVWRRYSPSDRALIREWLSDYESIMMSGEADQRRMGDALEFLDSLSQ